MKNITELRQELVRAFDDIRCGDLDIKAAKELNNTAGKIINTVKVELECCAMRKEIPNINFLKIN